MDCTAAADSLRGFASFLIIVGTGVAIWMMYDISGMRKPKIIPTKDRGVVYCPLHRGDRVDCEDKHK